MPRTNGLRQKTVDDGRLLFSVSLSSTISRTLTVFIFFVTDVAGFVYGRRNVLHARAFIMSSITAGRIRYLNLRRKTNKPENTTTHAAETPQRATYAGMRDDEFFYFTPPERRRRRRTLCDMKFERENRAQSSYLLCIRCVRNGKNKRRRSFFFFFTVEPTP